MNIVVCVKQIPDPAAPGALDPSTNTLKREGKLILDESDSYGVEMALQLAAAAGGGEVSLVSMAPPPTPPYSPKSLFVCRVNEPGWPTPVNLMSGRDRNWKPPPTEIVVAVTGPGTKSPAMAPCANPATPTIAAARR